MWYYNIMASHKANKRSYKKRSMKKRPQKGGGVCDIICPQKKDEEETPEEMDIEEDVETPTTEEMNVEEPEEEEEADLGGGMDMFGGEGGDGGDY